MDGWSVEHWSNDTDRVKGEYSQKPVPEPHCSPQIPHIVSWNQPRPPQCEADDD